MPTQSNCVVVLGATSAIAQAVCRKLCDRGSKVSFLLLARNEEKLNALRQDLVARGASVQTRLHDLADEAKVVEAWDWIGNASRNGIDHVFLAYGDLGHHDAGKTSTTETLETLRVNFTSAAAHLTIAATTMSTHRRGAITVLSSVAGDRGRQSNYIYGSAKAALTIFCQGLRHRLFPQGVRVVTIKAGFVDSPMTVNFKKGPLWRSPEQIAPRIVETMRKENRDVYVPGFWCFIMLIIKNVPNKLFLRTKL